MKNTTNVFLKGMRSDMHPLSTSLQEYTDALNATLITFNGNEQMMLNDMGNTLILDKVLGNVILLNKGFIPLGVKEFGGIIYIASVNSEGVGEIGSVPSPVIEYDIKKLDPYPSNTDIVDVGDDSNPSEIIQDRIVQGVVRVTREKFSIGDKFILAFDFLHENQSEQWESLPEYFSKTYKKADGTTVTMQWPYFSHVKNYQDYKPGLFEIRLCSVSDYNIYDITDNVCLNPITYYTLESSEAKTSNWWFILGSR